MNNRVQISGLPPGFRLAEQVRRFARRLLRELQLRRVTLEIIFLGSAGMKRLKKKFLPRVGGPANTLSFAEPHRFPHPADRRRPLGEIFLNRDLIGEALARAKPLIVHSLLHLLGYHHQRSRDMIKMERLSKKLLQRK